MTDAASVRFRWLGVATVVLTLVGWSSVPLFIKHFAPLIDGWTQNGWRYGFIALIWMPVVIVGVYRGRLPKHIWRAAVWPAVFNSIGQICFTFAHYMIDPGLLTFALRAQIVFVTFGAAILFIPERRVIGSRWFIFGLALVLGGTVFTIFQDEGFGEQSNTLGVAIAIAAGGLFAAYALAVRRCMQGIPAITSFAVISQYTAGAMIVLMLLFGDRMGLTAITDLDLHGFVLLLFSAIVGIALGHVFYYISIERLGVAVSSGVIQLQPFGVCLGSLMIFGETLKVAQWVGGGAAVVGAGVILLVQRDVHRQIQRVRAQQTDDEPSELPDVPVTAEEVAEAVPGLPD